MVEVTASLEVLEVVTEVIAQLKSKHHPRISVNKSNIGIPAMPSTGPSLFQRQRKRKSRQQKSKEKFGDGEKKKESPRVCDGISLFLSNFSFISPSSRLFDIVYGEINVEFFSQFVPIGEAKEESIRQQESKERITRVCDGTSQFSFNFSLISSYSQR